MQKVITINLNGNAYQLDESAYTLLREYLDRAELQLKDNPDRAEILSDLEQAIADKCNRVLGPAKTVVNTAEVQRIIDEMGPVDPPSGDPAASAGPSHTTGERAQAGATRKRLYQISEGAMFSGVCTGIAAYLNVDVTFVRIAFVLLAVITKGVFVAVYLLLMVVVPHATTSEERAAAHGQPFNAQELIDSAKRNYAQFKGSRAWKRQWRRQQRQWRRHIRPLTGRAWGPPIARPFSYAGQLFAGGMLPVLTIMRVALFWVFVCLMASILSTNAIFGEPLPDDLPYWAVVVIVVFAYAAVAWPLRAAKRATYYALGAHDFGWIAAWDGFLGLALSVLCFWVVVNAVPEVHDFVDHMDVVRDNVQTLVQTFSRY
jgi:phage shock protein PspC (stress-responsive transcriptional regulator)